MTDTNYFVIVVVFVCVQQLAEAAKPTSYYLTDLCHKRNFSVIQTSFTGRTASGTIFVNRENEGLPSNLNCKVTIRPTNIYQHGVIFKVENSKSTPEPAKLNEDAKSNCEDYRMEFLLSHTPKDERYKSITRCFTDGPVNFQSASSVHVYFRFNNDSSSSSASSFHITFTNYQIDSCQDRKDFSCANTNCIWKSLVCDGRNNCGDNSDEEQLECGHNQRTTFFGTVWNKPTDMMSIFGLALACLTLFAVAASAFYLCGKTLRYRQTAATTTPAMWNNEGTIYPTEKNGYMGVTSQEHRDDRPPPYTQS